MKKSFLLAVKILAALFAAFAILLVAIRILVPMSRVERSLEKYLSRKLERDIHIQGLHIGFLGIGASEIRVSEIETRGVMLHWGLKALLRGFDMAKLRPTQTAGSLSIQHFKDPHYQANNLHLQWSLTHLDPSLRTVDGWIRLRQGAGEIRELERLVATSAAARVALSPLLLIQNMQRTGLVNLGLPDLSHWSITSVQGDYTLSKGVLAIRTFDVVSPVLNVGSVGQIVLPTEELSVDVSLKSPAGRGRGSLDIRTRVTGTLSKPKADLTSLKKKAFQATVRELLPRLGL